MPTNRLPLLGVVGLVLTAGLAATSGAVSAPATGSPVSAGSAQASSTIAFISEPAQGGYCGTVYVMNADGSGQRRLTNGGVPGCGQEWGAAWSPDGRRIAIVSDPKIYVMNADGGGQRRLTGTAGFEHSPAWSPDGRKIAFGRNGGVYVVNANGSGERRLTRTGAAFRGLAWSPDARRIAFVGTLGRGRHNLEIYVANADGTGQRRLTATRLKTAIRSGRPTGGGSSSSATGRSGSWTKTAAGSDG